MSFVVRPLHHGAGLTIGWLVSLVLVVALSPLEARERPRIYRNTLVADNNALLRGVMYNTDISGGALPNATEVRDIRNHGMNALHVYAESPFCPVAPGSYLNQIQTLSTWTAQESLYLVVTIGHGICDSWAPGTGWKRTGTGTCQTCTGGTGCDLSGEETCQPCAAGAGCDRSCNKFNPTFARCFWEKYAPALGSQKHVVFEIHNEPYFLLKEDTSVISQPSPQGVRDLQADIYNIIRTYAASTPVLLFSYGSLHSSAGVKSDWDAVASTVQQRYGRTLSSAAIAYHTYVNNSAIGQPAESVRLRIKELRSKNVALIGTEMPWGNTAAECGGIPASAANPCLSFPDVAVHEEEEVSWLSFLKIGATGHLKTVTDWTNRVRKPIQNGDSGNQIAIVWEPDFGIWPAVHQPPCGKTAGFKAWNEKWVSVSAQNVWIGQGPLTADRDALGVWEEFKVQCSASGTQLRTDVIGKYVDAGWTSDATPLWANASTVSASTTFRWLKLWDGSVVLRVARPYSNASRPTWRIISADANRTAPNPPELIDNRTRVGPWEKFLVTVW